MLAHFMLCHGLSYTREMWIRDFRLAQSAGIDAFVVNFDPSFPDAVAQLQRAYDAARDDARDFKLALSLDLAGAQADPAVISMLIGRFIDQPAALRFRGRPFLTTFAGVRALSPGRRSSAQSQITFGEPSALVGWTKLIRHSPWSGRVHWCPVWFLEQFWQSDQWALLELVDGLGNWDAWPLRNGKLHGDTDRKYVEALQPSDKPYVRRRAISYAHVQLGCVAPTFFCHHPSRNWARSADDDLFGRRVRGSLLRRADRPVGAAHRLDGGDCRGGQLE